MTPYKDLSREELLKEKENLEQQFAEIKAKGLKLDMSRGKPSTAQLNLSMGMMDVLDSNADLVCEEGVDCRNYGVLDGIKEAKELLADMTEVSPDNIIIYGNSSLNVMYKDFCCRFQLFRCRVRRCDTDIGILRIFSIRECCTGIGHNNTRFFCFGYDCFCTARQ